MVEWLQTVYQEYQLPINLLLLGYGVVLALAHYNLKGIHRFILEQYETEDLEDALGALAREIDESIIDRVREEFPFPFVSAPFLFGMYRVRRRNLIAVLGKRAGLPAARIEELLAQAAHITELKE